MVRELYWSAFARTRLRMLCSNIVVIMLPLWPIMFHFYTKNASVIWQRTYIVGVKTWITKTLANSILFAFYKLWRWCPQYIQDASWFLPSLLQIDISAFRANVIQVDELEAIGIYIHWYSSCACVTQLDHTPFSGKSRIMLALYCN